MDAHRQANACPTLTRFRKVLSVFARFRNRRRQLRHGQVSVRPLDEMNRDRRCFEGGLPLGSILSSGDGHVTSHLRNTVRRYLADSLWRRSGRGKVAGGSDAGGKTSRPAEGGGFVLRPRFRTAAPGWAGQERLPRYRGSQDSQVGGRDRRIFRAEPAGGQHPVGRIAGTKSQHDTAQYMQKKFGEFGLQKIRTDSIVRTPQWWPTKSRVSVKLAGTEGESEYVFRSAFPAAQLDDSGRRVGGGSGGRRIGQSGRSGGKKCAGENCRPAEYSAAWDDLPDL